MRGSPPRKRVLTVRVDSDWVGIGSGSLENCVSLQETSEVDGRSTILFTRSFSAKEARALSMLLAAGADMLDQAGGNPVP